MHKVLTKLKVVLSWDDVGLYFPFSIRKWAFTEKDVKYCVSITSHLCFSKMRLCLFLLTLALLRDLSLRFQALFSRDGSLSLSVLFPGCLKFSTTSLLTAAFGTQMKLHSLFLIHWELIVWPCSGEVLALWQTSS